MLADSMNRPLTLIKGVGPAAMSAVKTEFGAQSVLIHNAVGGAFGNFLKIDPQVLNGNF
jgi:hypothetical protein